MSLAMLHIESHFLIILILIDHYNCARLPYVLLEFRKNQKKKHGLEKGFNRTKIR